MYRGDFLNKFSNRLKELREENNLTQNDLSKILLTKYNIKTSAQNISYWEKGREPNYDTIIILASYFNVTTDYLLGSSNIKNNSELNLFSPLLPRQLMDIFKNIEKTYFYMENNIQWDGQNSHFNETYRNLIILINKFFYEFETSLLNFSNSNITNIDSYSNSSNNNLKPFIDNNYSRVIINRLNNDLFNLQSYIPKVISLMQEIITSYSILTNGKVITSLFHK